MATNELAVNVTEDLSETRSQDNMEWRLRYKCAHCSEVAVTPMQCSAQDEPRAENPKFTVISKCQHCSYMKTLDITENGEIPYYKEESGSKTKTLALYVRRSQQKDVFPKDGWVVVATVSLKTV